MIITYVILHYMAGKDTIECTESILRATDESELESKVVIVDNGSVNDSYQDIKCVFAGNKQVTILHSEKNLGFARGNNIGFVFAKHQLKADFIVLLNNDTILAQKNFNEIIAEKYDKYHFAVLGPDIVTLDGNHQNPGKTVEWTRKKIFLFRQKKRLQYLLAHFNIFDSYLTLNESVFIKERVGEDLLNIQLHGACLIFSREYINKFAGIYDRTFLYMEEDILKLRADYYGYLMMYTPDIVITHKEDIATNMIATKDIEKKRRMYKNLLDSSKIYADLKKQYIKGTLKK